jgi:1-aminocyclopropane-1-carboxylate deaminase/D-cysteine desulfhydrase-like pyridoxal-dependent ACC family enzyme
LPAGFGGNKMRSLDLVGADALRQGADVIITGAGPLSNHVRASAVAAAKVGLRCEIVYWGEPPQRVEGNHLLTRMLGADIRFTGDADRNSVDRGVDALAAEHRERGEKFYCIPRGGACALAVLAHLLAVRETLDQLACLNIKPDIIFMAVGGGATLAGWLLGTALFGASWRLESVAVSRHSDEVLARAKHLAMEAAALIGCAPDLQGVEVAVHDGFIGDGYGAPSKEGQEAIALAARAEGVFFDPVYTGKAMAGYSALIAQGRYERIRTALFLHTGGTPGLFTASVEKML